MKQGEIKTVLSLRIRIPKKTNPESIKFIFNKQEIPIPLESIKD